jgi:hypothetical protein
VNPDPLNGYTIKEYLAIELPEIRAEIAELRTEVRAVHTPLTCPLAIEVRKNAEFRIRGLAIISFVVLLSGAIEGLVIHFT